jgi:hypothetical protein
VGVYSSLNEFCDILGVSTLKTNFYNPVYWKGSSVKLYNANDKQQVTLTPTFNYFEVKNDGSIIDQKATEPSSPISINTFNCQNFVVGVYLKYSVNDKGTPVSAQF